MLTKADDYPVHQTPDPIAHPGTDRNFYDRFFFCGWSADGKTYLAAAMGLYPNLDIIDGAFAIAHDGVQHSVFASRILHSERLDTQVGPLAIEILEPLAAMRLRVTDNPHRLTADLTFLTALPPVEEERHHMRVGPRTIFDLTRMSIFGRYEGWVDIDGRRIALAGFCGIRDRSWGVRQIGARDPQPLIPSPNYTTLWIWMPIIFEAMSLMFVNLEGARGEVVKRRAELITADGVEVLADVHFDMDFDPETRRARSARLRARSQARGIIMVEATTEWAFPLVGVGYNHPKWMHGAYHGPMAADGERRELSELDPRAPENLHIHAPAAATLRYEDGEALHGRGIVEQIVMGDHDYPGLRE